jgi:hypothetical protein
MSTFKALKKHTHILDGYEPCCNATISEEIFVENVSKISIPKREQRFMSLTQPSDCAVHAAYFEAGLISLKPIRFRNYHRNGRLPSKIWYMN